MTEKTITVSASMLVTGADSGKLFDIPVDKIAEIRKSTLHNGSVIQLDKKPDEKVVRYFVREPFETVISRIHEANQKEDTKT